MKRLLAQFDGAYVISLRERHDRRRDLVKEFRRQGIDMAADKVQFVLVDRPAEVGPFPSLGIRGSFSSHRYVLKLAVEQGLRNVVVFEDDASFRAVGEDALENLVSGLENLEWDVLYLGYLEPECDDLSGPFNPYPHDTIGGHFYAVNGPFMPRMIEYMDACEARSRDHPLGGPMGRDAVFNHIRYVYPDVRVYLAVPNLAVQRSSRTDLHRLSLYDRLPVLRPAVSALRKLKHSGRMKLDALKLQSKNNGKSSA